jgi:D-alanyl-D-alanine carboxypeptidase/D-alanyl-D-alanine-endopeptidase (penicillin-binding protein 4)
MKSLRLPVVSCCALALSLALWTAIAPFARAEDGRGAQALAALLANRALRGAHVGVEVSDLETGTRLVARDADLPLVPASNQKLIVASAALARWGPAHHFETPLHTEGTLDPSGVLEGTLWVVGRGDPSLVSEVLWRMAEEVRLRGISEIRGGIAVDVSYFDGERFHPDWGPISGRAYQAPVGAFAANYSSFRVDVSPARQRGDPALLRVAPAASYLRIASDARSLPRADRLVIDLQPLPDGSGELVRARGTFPLGADARTFWRSVRFPELYAASILRAHLEAQGVTVRGATRIGSLPPGTRQLLRFQGESLGRLVRDLNKFSNNFIAEQLTKILGAEASGAPGSWREGALALEAHLRSIGLATDALVIADGSGLSPRNRVPASALVSVLRSATRRFDYGPEFLASLPIGGLDGTLQRRLDASTPLRGKTGHLSHVGSLSGVVADDGGRRLAFAVLVNGARGGGFSVDAAIDDFLVRLRRDLVAVR